MRAYVRLATGFTLSLALLALCLSGGRGRPAHAQGPITVGFDMNTAGNTCPGDGVTDCTLGTIDACVQAPTATPDGKANDGCPNQGLYSEADDWCGGGAGDTVNQDGDTTPDDGCPGGPTAVGVSEAANHCNDAVNDDQTDDGVVNDGCPQVGCRAEADAQCENDSDDDASSCIKFDVFLKDLPQVSGQPDVGGFRTFSYVIHERNSLPVGPVTAITHADKLVNLIHQALPQAVLVDNSDPPGTSLPPWKGVVADLFGAVEDNPPFTKGVLSRLQIDTTGSPDGIYGLTIDSLDVRDVVADNYCDPASPNFVGCNTLDAYDGYGLIAIGRPCPAPVGGMARLPHVAESDSSARNHIALAVLAAVALLAVTAGVRHARRLR